MTSCSLVSNLILLLICTTTNCCRWWTEAPPCRLRSDKASWRFKHRASSLSFWSHHGHRVVIIWYQGRVFTIAILEVSINLFDTSSCSYCNFTRRVMKYGGWLCASTNSSARQRCSSSLSLFVSGIHLCSRIGSAIVDVVRVWLDMLLRGGPSYITHGGLD